MVEILRSIPRPATYRYLMASVGVAMFHGFYRSIRPFRMAGAAALPPMLVFLLAQRYFIRGIQ